MDEQINNSLLDIKNKFDTKFDTDFYNQDYQDKLFQILIFFIIYIWLIYYIYSLVSFYHYFTSYSQYTGYIKSCDKNKIEEINNLKPILLKHNTTEKSTYIITIIIFVILVLIYSYILFDKKDDLNIHDDIQKLYDYIQTVHFYNLIILIYIIFLLLKISYLDKDDNILNKNRDVWFNITFNFLILGFLLSLKYNKKYAYYMFILIIILIIINFIYNYISYNEDPDTKNFTNKKKINLDIIMNLLLYFFGIIFSIFKLLSDDSYEYSNLIKTFVHLFILIFIITFIFIIHYYSKFNNTLYDYDGFFGIKKTYHKNDDINDRNFIDDFTTTFYVLFIVSTIAILIIIKTINKSYEFEYILNILTMFLIFTILLFITGGLYKGYKNYINFTQDSYDYKSDQYNKNIDFFHKIDYSTWEQITNQDQFEKYTNADKKESLINLLKSKININIIFTQEEWITLGITDFTQNNYVNIDNKYFKSTDNLKWEEITDPNELTEYTNANKKELLITLLKSKINIILTPEEWKTLEITDFTPINYITVHGKYFKLKNNDYDFHNIIKNYKQINNDFEHFNFKVFYLDNNKFFILIDNYDTSHNKKIDLFKTDLDTFLVDPINTDEEVKNKKKIKYMTDVKNYIINNISTKYYLYSYISLKDDADIKKDEEQIYNKITNLFTFIIITTLIISIIMYSYFKQYYYNINNLILILITISIIIIIITDIYLKNI